LKRRADPLNTRLLLGIILIVLGILVFAVPAFLQIIVGLALIIGGLWLALQAAPTGRNI
jgi:uncharacterized membrane protein HdeD (DUF308 family)